MFKRSVVIRASKLNFKNKINFDSKIVIFFTLLLCGVILGCFISSKSAVPWHNYLKNFFANYFITKSKSGFITCFSSVFLSYFVIILYVYLMGFSAIGMPFITITPLLYGVYCGTISSQFYILYDLKGIFYFFMINVIPYSIVGAIIIKCCSESNTLSKNLFYYILGDKTDHKDVLIKEYTINYIVLLIPVMIAGILETVLFKIFYNLFNFID